MLSISLWFSQPNRNSWTAKDSTLTPLSKRLESSNLLRSEDVIVVVFQVAERPLIAWGEREAAAATSIVRTPSGRDPQRSGGLNPKSLRETNPRPKLTTGTSYASTRMLTLIRIHLNWWMARGAVESLWVRRRSSLGDKPVEAAGGVVSDRRPRGFCCGGELGFWLRD
jgi:hypothetical protein